MFEFGGDRGTQTLDFFHAMEALYQLSYIPEYSGYNTKISLRLPE